ncbi:MAG: M20/M25/M40 family metallo-hydrolase [Pyrinomonadaceae bacterium]|nr:M20/M25/M40 family metallo-hydrolase [Pyrinomonadaceae bacterium]
MKRSIALILFALLLAGTPSAFAQKAARSAAPNFGNVEGVTAKQLKDYLTFIASDELEGRDTPSRGLDIAAMFIAQHLSRWGVKPGGDNGSYFQKVPLRLNKIDAEKTRLEINGVTYSYGKDFLASQLPANISGSNLVFVGNGWLIRSKNINPYEGIDVKDKVVIVVNSLPKGITFNDLKGPVGDDWMSPPYYAQKNGAKAVIAFSTFGSLANWEGAKWNQADKGLVEFGKQQAQITIPTITVTPRVIASMFAGEKASGGSLFTRSITGEAMESFDLKATKKVAASIGVKTENIHTQNVIGIIEGSDPVLKNEYVAIGAHYDHVGTNPFAAGDDKIWNGADDDGSGTVSVLSIAEAIAKGTQRPKRSFLFIWHAGEEKGLWGSEYFADNPTVPIGSIITELNIDMIGRYQNPGDENHPQNKNLPKPGEVFTIGSRMMSTELGELSDSVNRSFLALAFNTKYDDPKDPEQFFYRSDHFNYAKKGIPIIFYMDGSHADYHQVSDSVEKINFEQMEKVARTIMATGWTLANAAKRPTVDKPLPASVTGN